MVRKLSIKPLLGISLIGFLLITRCVPVNTSVQTQSPGFGVKTFTAVVESTKAEVPDTQEVATAVNPLAPTLDSRKNAIPTSPTYLPTLDYETAQQTITRLMETNDHCYGPCFWGFIPYVSSFDDAIQFLTTLNELNDGELGNNSDGTRYYRNSYVYSHDAHVVSINLIELDGTIQSISVVTTGLSNWMEGGNDWLAFRPDNYLKANGKPSQVKIVMSQGQNGRVSNSFVFLYDDRFIEYSGNQYIVIPQDTILRACPNGDHNIKRFRLGVGKYNEDTYTRWIDIDKISSLSLEEFFDVVTRDPNQACFDLDFDKFSKYFAQP